MEHNRLLEKNKNNILNLSIVLLALFIAFQIYKGSQEQMNSLAQQKNDELKKNEAAIEIASLEKKLDAYKKVFIRKDLGAVIDTISAIAKRCAVKVTSIKPDREEAHADYFKSSFSLSINASDYHTLGNFVSQIESAQDIFLVDELKINSPSANNQSVASVDKDLKVNLKISMIIYL